MTKLSPSFNSLALPSLLSSQPWPSQNPPPKTSSPILLSPSHPYPLKSPSLITRPINPQPNLQKTPTTPIRKYTTPIPPFSLLHQHQPSAANTQTAPRRPLPPWPRPRRRRCRWHSYRCGGRTRTWTMTIQGLNMAPPRMGMAMQTRVHDDCGNGLDDWGGCVF